MKEWRLYPVNDTRERRPNGVIPVDPAGSPPLPGRVVATGGNQGGTASAASSLSGSRLFCVHLTVKGVIMAHAEANARRKQIPGITYPLVGLYRSEEADQGDLLGWRPAC